MNGTMTADFILLNFKVKGQDGAYILPKRMDSKKFPFSTIRKHLNESVGPAKSVYELNRNLLI